MLDFLRGEADVLVCTTIVESGLDIPSANTLIVERADELGLAQLYQIRGRVGRSRERAYAYLLYPSRGRAHRGGRAAAVHALRLHGARLRLQDRDARPRDPRRRQPARRRSSPGTWRRWASSSTWGCSTRRCACWRGDSADEAAGAGADGPARGRLRARRLRALRGGEDRDAPARGGRARDRRPDPAARGARGPLRAAARAARQPDQAPGRAHQARPRRAPGPWTSAAGGWRWRRSSSTRSGRPRAARGGPGGASTSPGGARSACGCPRRPPERFPAVVAAAEAILEVATRPTSEREPSALLPFRTAQGT